MNEFIISTGAGNKVISSGDDGSRKGDRDIVQEIIDKFDDIDNTSHEELIKLAKELPDGKGEDVIIGLGVGWWRGDEPEEQEFFRIIDSKFDRSRTGQRKGGYYNDALQAHGVYHGHQDWEDVSFVPEDEALETLDWIAEDEGKTVDQLITELHKFRKENNK